MVNLEPYLVTGRCMSREFLSPPGSYPVEAYLLINSCATFIRPLLTHTHRPPVRIACVKGSRALQPLQISDFSQIHHRDTMKCTHALSKYPANNFTLLQRCHNMTFLLWQRCKVRLQQRKFVDSQIGCDNVVKQRCCITKLQPTHNLKIKIALNFINIHSFKYQLNFFTLDFLKVIHGPLILIFQLSLYFATTSFFVVATKFQISLQF